MIRLTNIKKVYTTETIETVALDGINIHVQKGDFLAVMGPSGCGKSTLRSTPVCIIPDDTKEPKGYVYQQKAADDGDNDRNNCQFSVNALSSLVHSLCGNIPFRNNGR